MFKECSSTPSLSLFRHTWKAKDRSRTATLVIRWVICSSFSPSFTMKAAVSLALLLLGATSGWAAKASLSGVERVTNLPSLPNKFIVEVAEASDIPSKRAIGTPHEQLYRSLRERKISFDVNKEYDAPGIFVGAALTLTNTQDVANILSTDGVLAIRPIRSFPRPVPVSSKVVSPGDAGLPDSESTHITTGVDKLHARGITGKGIKIGILDTGIDYTHPFLGGGFGPGFKVQGGFDLVGDAYDGTNTPMPDPDPLDQCAGHGTHVAGIIGANPGNEFNVSGVAFDSTIFAYRIFGCEGSVTDDVIVDGLIMGVKAGMDILTMSLGGSDGWTEGTATVVSSRIAASGKIVTIAAGNEGASGAWFTSGPGNAIDAISVASSDNTVIPLQSLTVSGVTHDPIVYYDTFPLPVNGTLPLYATSNDTTVVDDACNPLPDSTPDLSGFVVLVRRGTCTFVTKLANIAAFGGTTTLIYDNGSGFGAVDVGNFSAVLIQAEDGAFLAQQFAAGASISVTFPQSGSGVEFPAPTGGLVSTFTTYGPTNDFYFKPAITAPGGNILSTFPVPLGSWALLSGTSMATPFMAGSSALVLAVKGKTASVATGARTLFEATAKPISSSLTDGDPLQSVTQQGGGLVQVFDAIFGTTLLSPAELILNDTANFAGPQKFTVKNTANTAKTYTLSHVPAGTAVTFDAGSILPILGPVPLSTDFATVSFNSGKFTLQPGQSHQVVATITPPKGVDATTFPVYSGFIFVTSGTESVHATYLGLTASLKNAQVVDNTDVIFGFDLPALLDSQGNVQDGPVTYTFVGDDAPTVLWRQSFGTPLFRLDLVSPNISFTGTLNSRAPISFANPHNGGTFAKVPILGSLLEIPFLSRSDEIDLLDNTVLLSNTFANGTIIPNGSYKVLLRSLRITGDPTNEADYESWLSQIIGIAA
ncbi:subtilisin-like protease [Mycena capillaripes]|nr:subtilisin-like protease [Mycena capillaripes]